jgi:hypothetical protein
LQEELMKMYGDIETGEVEEQELTDEQKAERLENNEELEELKDEE